jgi:hypothetical protein
VKRFHKERRAARSALVAVVWSFAMVDIMVKLPSVSGFVFRGRLARGSDLTLGSSQGREA